MPGAANHDERMKYMEYAGTKQEEFRSYEHLLLLRSIAEQYTEGRKYCPVLEKVLQQIASRTYRVAVIGEFKRGKSSLLNALLGTEILPTDILPTTGTVSRIVYGTTQEMTICYKDGTQQQRDLSELQHYGTKLETDAEERLRKIQEILVQYPSVFCKDGIELVDTPGLNDDEYMTETTLGVLKDIDAAIVVISAKMPLSMTERDLIVRLLSCHEIHDIIFVVTFIDAVSKRRREQDRMIAYIRQRITEETLELVQQTYRHDAAILEKADRLLKEPKMFAVSSTQAMEGFLRDDMDLLDESRFPTFKNELLTLLTAQQSTMIGRKTEEIDAYVQAQLPNWYQAEMDMLEQQLTAYQEKYSLTESYFAEARAYLENEFLETDQAIDAMDVGAMLENCYAEIKKEFVRQLCTLNGTNPTDADIKHVLQMGTVQANERIGNCFQQAEEGIRTSCMAAEQRVLARRSQWCPAGRGPAAFPALSCPMLEVTMLYPASVSLVDYDIMPYLEERVFASIQNIPTELDAAVSLWRRDLLAMLRDDAEKEKPVILQTLKERKRAVEFARATLQSQYQTHRQTVYPGEEM